MRDQVAVLIPTVGRPHRVAEIVQNVTSTCEDARVYFIVEADDIATMEAVLGTRNCTMIQNLRSRNYAGAINTGVQMTRMPFVFAGADDLQFHPGWFETAVATMTDTIKVVGTNDLGNSEVLAGEHATHYLVARDYAENGVADGDGIMLHEGYAHNWCDKEFIMTARHRGTFAPCLFSVVEHRHWAWGKATIDETYNKGSRTEPADRERYMARSHLWR
jgi:hypothetical protein